MKKIFGIIALLFASVSFAFTQEQKGIVTQVIKVDGSCGQCKKRIENAAYIPGVKRAEWNKETKELTVTFKNEKTNIEKIETSIANAGHDAGNTKATKTAYEKLPECCAYKEVEAH